MDAASSHRKKIISYQKDGTAILRFKNVKARILTAQQFDLTQATIFGLNERLTSSSTAPITGKNGITLRDEFNAEWEKYTRALAKAKGKYLDYGVYAYYAQRNHLVRYCPAYWQRIVSIASSSKLIADPTGKRSWKEIRDIFDHTTVAVAGGSVGNSILHLTVMDLRPQHVKIADKSLYKMENINRVRLGYWDIVDSNARRRNLMETLLRNKAETTASQLYATDPFLNVHIYREGVHQNNIDQFFDGKGKEPAADIIIEEVDDPRVKLLIREEAKKRRVPLIMASDLGSCVQLDILRYDKEKNLSLTYGTPDSALRASMENVYDSPSDRSIFFQFVDDLVGTDYRQDELKRIIDGKSEIPTSTIIPQLGSTAAVAAGLVAETVARIRLGYDYAPRIFINKRTFEVKIYP